MAGESMGKALGVLPQYRNARIPGQVPNKERLELFRLASQPAKPTKIDDHGNMPRPTAQSVVRGLGLDRAAEGRWIRLIQDVATPATTALVVRKAVVAKLQEDKADPELRRALLQRTLRYHRDLKKSFTDGSFEDLVKGVGHKYLRRWKGKDGKWRYEYKVLATATLKIYQVGDKVSVRHRGQAGHFEVLKARVKDGKRQLRVRHDETGKESWISEMVLAELFRQTHNVQGEARAVMHKVQAALGGYDPEQGPAVATKKPTKHWKKQLEKRKERLSRLFDPHSQYHSLMDFAAKAELFGYYKAELHEVAERIKPMMDSLKAELEAQTEGSSWDIRKRYIDDTRDEFKWMIGPVWGVMSALNWEMSSSHSEQKGDNKHSDPDVSKLVQEAWKAGEKLTKPADLVHGAFQGFFTGKIEPERWLKATKSKITRYFNLVQEASAASTAATEAREQWRKRSWGDDNPVTEVVPGRGAKFVLQLKHATDRQKERVPQHIHSLEASIAKVKAAGFGGAVRDLTVHMDYRPSRARPASHVKGHGEVMPAGTFHPYSGLIREETAGKGGITVFSTGFRTAMSSSVMTHEVGHRFYYRDLTDGERAEWQAKVEERTVTPTKEDVDAVWEAIKDKYRHAEGLFDLDALTKGLDSHGAVGVALRGIIRQTYHTYSDDPVIDKGTVKGFLDGIAGHPVVDPFVSFYGGTNDSEYFAEAFMHYVEGGRRNLPKWARATFEKVVHAAKLRKSRPSMEDLEDLEKAAHHKYLRRVPSRQKGRKWNYVYATRSSHHDSDFQVGEKIRLTHGPQAGHYEVASLHGAYVTVKHDETGHEVTIHKDKLSEMFRDEHHRAEGRKRGEGTVAREGRQQKAREAAQAAYSASGAANRSKDKVSHQKAAESHAAAADAGAKNAALHRQLAEVHQRAVVTAEAHERLAKEKKVEPSKLVVKLERKPRPGYLGTKAQSYRALMSELGEMPRDFHVVDLAYRKWKGGHGEKPKPWEGGELDSVNEALGCRKPSRHERRGGKTKDCRVSSVREAWDRLTVGVKRWDDPKIEQAFKILKDVPGLERIRLPQDVLARVTAKGATKEQEAYYEEKLAAQAAGDHEADPEELDVEGGVDDSFDFGWNVEEEHAKSLARLDGGLVNVWSLRKAEPRGGTYHRRVPKSGGGYRYYYDKDQYERHPDRHVHGPEAKVQRAHKAVLGHVEQAGKGGAQLKSLKALVKGHGADGLVAAVRKGVDAGDIVHRGGKLYHSSSAPKKTKKSRNKIRNKTSEKPQKSA